ncbi:ATP-dependent zinc protease [Salsipaludibacter albus]|uniref:ATP-dependent zinc protease family protein n=1 Tax=Salsipaludibacter albus TaxID=2849650 RepID=UPI0030840706|nr:ATP-dependent zinc protease [Salsipaludibacter albus]
MGERAPVAVGWREWVALPDWGVDHMKAKVDTGARTSAIHAWDLEPFDRDGSPWVRFSLHPWQGSDDDPVQVEAPVVDHREVRSSSGDTQRRPVVHTDLHLVGLVAPIELTLTNRDEMGFRMLVGREALRGRFVVDPGRSYLGGRPPADIRRRNR